MPRKGRLAGVGSLVTVTAAGEGDPLSSQKFQTVCYQHDLAPSVARV
jgi:hypothetical protein